tara:strand:- start:10099 stop:10350 length:252 start_codon:yes stop_codon:yes gene_type:complete
LTIRGGAPNDFAQEQPFLIGLTRQLQFARTGSIKMKSAVIGGISDQDCGAMTSPTSQNQRILDQSSPDACPLKYRINSQGPQE